MATGTILLPMNGATPDSSNPPAPVWTAADRMNWVFDDTVDELLVWTFRMPENYASALVAKIQYSMVSAITLEVVLAVEVMAVSDTEDVDTDSFDTANTSAETTVPGTAGDMDEISITLTNDDSVAAGDYVAVRFSRDANNAGDDASGDIELWALSLEYTTR